MAMSHAKQRHEFDGERSGGREHPVVGWIGLLAILITIVLLVWARVAVIGTRDIEQTLVETSPDAAGAFSGMTEVPLVYNVYGLSGGDVSIHYREFTFRAGEAETSAAL